MKTRTTHSDTTRISQLAGKLALVIAIVVTCLGASAGTSEAHKLSKGRAMAIAAQYAKNAGQEYAADYDYSIGGSWYSAGWASSCQMWQHAARCRVTMMVGEPSYGTERCEGIVGIKFRSNYSYSVRVWAIDWNCT